MSLDLSQGTRQVGNYDILTKIAEGGMGAVYKARSRHTGDIVAIKIIPTETARNPLTLKRFEQEFKAASLIDHPNVVKAIDYCGAAANPFLVMEFVDGESLGQRIERAGRLTEGEALRLIRQVCEGLHRAHKQGLIHRDVKPDNIMVTHDGLTAKLTDLGLVKDIEGEMNLTRTGRGLGTPHYMAPEQFRNAKSADVRCDVYSLGATLYSLVTGEVPFNKTSPLECWLKKTKNDFPDPKQINPSISDRVNWAIKRAMSADPNARPVNCREFMEDLTGEDWRAGSGAYTLSDRVPASAPEPGMSELWYMVYRGLDGKVYTVKGTAENIRRNARAGLLGDINQIVVCRTKAGPFLAMRAVAEFRDLVITPAPVSAVGSPHLPTGRLSITAFDPPSGLKEGSGTSRMETGPEPPPTDPHNILPITRPPSEHSGQHPIKPAVSPGRYGSLQAFLPWFLIFVVATAIGVGMILFLK